MRIIVCIKQVPDPEGPPAAFVICPESNKVEPQGIPPVLSLFDENALEAALRIKDADQENVRISLLSIGKRISDAVLSKGLAVGADELFKVEDELLDASHLDSYGTVMALASAIEKIGDFDLVLVGRQAADWNAGQVGIGLATMLGIPAVSLARKVDVEAENLLIERVLPNGYETVRTSLPCVVMVSNEVGELRYPTLLQRKKARKKPITEWDGKAIGIDGPFVKRVVLCRLSVMELKEGMCKIIEGTSPSDTGRKLAKVLRDDKVL